MLHLPPHLLSAEILSRLDTPTVSTCRQVCAAWRSASEPVLLDRGWRSMRSWAATHHMLCTFCRRQRAPVHQHALRLCDWCQRASDPNHQLGQGLVTLDEALQMWPADAARMRPRKARRLDDGRLPIYRVSDVWVARRNELRMFDGPEVWQAQVTGM